MSATVPNPVETLCRYIRKGDRKQVEDLLASGVDVNANDSVGDVAIDVAWRHKKYKLVELLLDYDSRFPKGFDQNVKDGLKQATFQREKLHNAVDKGDVVQLQSYLDEKPHLKLWLNTNNESLCGHAVRKNRIHVCALLFSRGCEFRNEEERSCLYQLTPVQEWHLRRRQSQCLRGCEVPHLASLQIRTKNPRRNKELESEAKQLYVKLNSFDFMSTILKVVDTSVHFMLYFDQSRTNLQQVNGVVNLSSQTIFISGQKGCPKTLGMMAYHLCFLSLHLVYRNSGKPYGQDESDSERVCRYKAILSGMKQRQHELHPALQSAFQSNVSDDVICHIPQMLVEYEGDNAHNDHKKGEHFLVKQAPELLNFFTQNMLCDLESYIRQHDSDSEHERIKYENALLGQVSRVEHAPLASADTLDIPDVAQYKLVIATAVDPIVAEVSAYVAVRQTGEPFLFLETSQWSSSVQEVITQNACSFVLITYKPIDADRIPHILEFLSHVSEVIGTMVVFIADGHHKMYLEESAKVSTFYSSKYTIIHCSEGSDHVESVTNSLLRWSTVSFQGSQELPLQHLIDTFWLSQVIDSKTVEDIKKSKTISIGPPLIRCEQGDCFIERKFERRIRVEQLTSSPSDVFALMGCTEETVTDILPPGTNAHWFQDLEVVEKFVLVAAISEYQQLTKSASYANKVVHLVERVDDHLYLWRTSNGPPSKLRKCVLSAVSCPERDILLESKDKTVVVCGAPGMGKTTTATHLPSEMKRINPRTWTFYVRLSNQIGSMNGISNIFLKFSMLCGIQEGSLTHTLFKESLKRGTPFEVVVVLDGFDEISQSCRADILRLCVDLKMSFTFKLIVFSRNVYKTLLEDTFATVAFDMVPFDKQDQITFLKQYWQQRAPQEIAEEQLTFFANLIVDCFPACHCGGETRSLAEVPLLLRLAAESDEKAVLSGKATGLLHSKYLTILEIYVKYIEQKYQIWKGNQSQNGKADEEHALLRRFFEALHRDALKSTLQGDTFSHLYREHGYSSGGTSKGDPQVDNSNSQGSVLACDRMGVDLFEHKTVQEFLTASWLYRKIKSTGSVPNAVRDIILDLYKITCHYQIVRYFFDSHAVSRYPFHIAVMNNDIGYIRGHMTPDSIDAFDDFGRTTLHVAVLYADEHIVSRLACECSWDAMTITDKFGFTPVMYADRLGAWAKLGCLYVSYMALGPHRVVNVVNMQTALHNAANERRLEMSVFYEAVAKERVEFLRLLLSRFQGRLDDIKDGEKRTLLFHVNNGTTLSILCQYSDSYNPCDVNVQDAEGCTPLHYAALANNLDVVMGLCLTGADVNRKDQRGETPLFSTARRGFSDIVSYLISFGADVNALDRNLNTALHIACQHRHRKCAQLLLDSGTNAAQRNVWGLVATEFLSDEDAKALNLSMHAGGRQAALKRMSGKSLESAPHRGRHSSDPGTMSQSALESHGATASNRDLLHSMILLEKTEAHKIDQFIQRRNDLNIRNSYGETPLLLACSIGSDMFVHCLLKYNASANISDNSGTLPLHAAAKNGQLSTSTYNMLIEHSGDINSADGKGRSALVIACENGHSNIVQCLLENNADANITGRKGRLPLHSAAKFGRLPEDCIRLLARRTIDVNALDSNGETALHLALEARHANVIVSLLEENCRADTADKRGRTALHKAVSANVGENTFDLIISHTRDINHRDIDGRCALHEAAWSKNPTAIIVLLRAGADANVKDHFGCTPLHNACESGLMDRYCFLALTEGTRDLNQYDNTGFTPLMYACYEKHGKPIQWLLEHGAQVSDRGQPFNHFTVAYQRSLPEENLLSLIERLDDINRKVHLSRTALCNACLHGHVKIVRYLLSKKADVNIPDEDGRTGMHHSSLKGHLNIVKLLLPHAEAHARDKYDRTAWDLAKKKGNTNIVHAIEALWGKPPPGKAISAYE